jgi:hypothetical protein
MQAAAFSILDACSITASACSADSSDASKPAA